MKANFVFKNLQAKPSLADQNVILIFVIGGINGLEVQISRVLSAYIVIFSSRICFRILRTSLHVKFVLILL